MLFTLQSLSAKYRMVTKDGRDYMVVPGVPIREQVLNTYLVPGEEISHFVAAWNGIPLTIQHPKSNGGSANAPEPDVAVIGRFFNAAWDEQENKLTGEYWFDVTEAMKYQDGQAIVNAIKAGDVLENSTGYFADEEQTPGQFKGVDYQTIHRNLRPDHIALLPGKTGACSVKDGCGVNRNQNVFSNCSACPHAINSKEKTMTLKELIALLQGKGYKVQHNEEAQTFEVEPPPPAEEPVVQNSQPQLTQNEMDAIRGYISLTTEFGGPDAFKQLLLAMRDVAPVVQNARDAEATHRADLVASIKTNSTLFGDDDLAGMTIPQLTKLNAQISVNFAGAGGGYTQQNATEALGLPDSFSAQKEK